LTHDDRSRPLFGVPGTVRSSWTTAKATIPDHPYNPDLSAQE
jgi:hypothetical protein